MLSKFTSDGQPAEPAVTQARPFVVDVHVHLFPPDVRADRPRYYAGEPGFAQMYGTPGSRMAGGEELIAAMDEAGVTCSVALGFGWQDQARCQAHNDYLLEEAQAHARRIIPFCCVQPAAGDRALYELERCARLGARGVGEIMPDYQDVALDDERLWRPIAAACRELGLILLLHASEPVGHNYIGKGRTTPDRLWPLIQLCQDVDIILAHWGGGFGFYEFMPEVARLARRVYYDCSASLFLYRRGIFRMMARLAPDRILFGSDYPLVTPKRMLHHVDGAGLTPAQRAALYGDNAARLLGLCLTKSEDAPPAAVAPGW
jgi:predicted TIM-barrel fold metal-dependent hydrolase